MTTIKAIRYETETVTANSEGSAGFVTMNRYGHAKSIITNKKLNTDTYASQDYGLPIATIVNESGTTINSTANTYIPMSVDRTGRLYVSDSNTSNISTYSKQYNDISMKDDSIYNLKTISANHFNVPIYSANPSLIYSLNNPTSNLSYNFMFPNGVALYMSMDSSPSGTHKVDIIGYTSAGGTSLVTETLTLSGTTTVNTTNLFLTIYRIIVNSTSALTYLPNNLFVYPQGTSVTLGIPANLSTLFYYLPSFSQSTSLMYFYPQYNKSIYMKNMALSNTNSSYSTTFILVKYSSVLLANVYYYINNFVVSPGQTTNVDLSHIPKLTNNLVTHECYLLLCLTYDTGNSSCSAVVNYTEK